MSLLAAALIAIPVGAYDGDTITVTIPEWPPLVGEAMPVRLLGIDTPEIRGKCEAEKALAKEARAFTRQAIQVKEVRLEDIGRGKYFRLVARVVIDGQDLGEQLLAAGLARPYGVKASWCE